MDTAREKLITSLRILCEQEGGEKAVAEAIGSSRKTIWQIINGTRLASGEPRGIGARMQKRLDAHFPGWHELWRENAREGAPALHIPLLENSASMGDGCDELAEDAISGSLPVSLSWAKARLHATHFGALRFIHGLGDSMEPLFTDGDILLVDTMQQNAAQIDGVYVLRAYGRLYVKRVRHTIHGQLEVSSDNPAVKTVDILDGSHQLDVLGRVIWVWNGRKV